jgi:hypothetical protein
VIAKPSLEAWKIEQAVLAALTLPREPGEAIDAYARRVVCDMDAQVTEAAETGTAVHAACQEYALHRKEPRCPRIKGFWEPWKLWFDSSVEEVGSVERVVVNPAEGFGGTVDLECKLKGVGWAVVDFKTQRVKDGRKGEPKPNYYETWPLQLAAYRQALRGGSGSEHALVSVVVDVERPREVCCKVWEEDQHWSVFQAAAELWRYCKGYDPRGTGDTTLCLAA